VLDFPRWQPDPHPIRALCAVSSTYGKGPVPDASHESYANVAGPTWMSHE
jgi:hypothetical protein